jgi:CheY-like chemotaxis protein
VEVELSCSAVRLQAGGKPLFACVAVLTRALPEANEPRELVRHLSHDLNNSLVAVRGYAQMIARDPGTGEAIKEFAAEISRAALRIQSISDQLRSCLAPQNRPPAQVAPRSDATPRVAPDAPRPEPTRRALIVEDDTAISEVLRYYVEEFFRIETEALPERALEEIGREKFDLIITDLKMPRISGLDILTHARRHQPTTPVIVISGLHRESPEAQEVLAAGAVDFLEKPFLNIESVRAVLRKYSE